MQDESKNGALTEVTNKLIIAATTLLVCYLIVEVDYADSFLVSKLIILGIKFEIPRETNFANDSQAKLGG